MRSQGYRPELIKPSTPSSERGPQGELAEAAMKVTGRMLAILRKRFPGLQMAMLSLWFPDGRATKHPTAKAKLCSAIAIRDDDKDEISAAELVPFLDELIWALLQQRKQYTDPGSPMSRELASVPPEVELMQWLQQK